MQNALNTSYNPRRINDLEHLTPRSLPIPQGHFFLPFANDTLSSINPGLTALCPQDLCHPPYYSDSLRGLFTCVQQGCIQEMLYTDYKCGYHRSPASQPLYYQQTPLDDGCPLRAAPIAPSLSAPTVPMSSPYERVEARFWDNVTKADQSLVICSPTEWELVHRQIDNFGRFTVASTDAHLLNLLYSPNSYDSHAVGVYQHEENAWRVRDATHHIPVPNAGPVLRYNYPSASQMPTDSELLMGHEPIHLPSPEPRPEQRRSSTYRLTRSTPYRRTPKPSEWWNLMEAGEMIAKLDNFIASERQRNVGNINASTTQRKKVKRFEAAFDGRTITEATMKRVLRDFESLPEDQRNLYLNEKAKVPFATVREWVRHHDCVAQRTTSGA